MSSDGFLEIVEAIISGKIRVGRIQPNYLESRFRFVCISVE